MEGIIKRLFENRYKSTIRETFSRPHNQLYHLSPINNRESILEEGLRAPVYLTWDYAEMIMEDREFSDRTISGGKIDLYVVDTSEVTLVKDSEWDEAGTEEEYDEEPGEQEILAYICREDIPSDKIKYLGQVTVKLEDRGHPGGKSRVAYPPRGDKGLDYNYFDR